MKAWRRSCSILAPGAAPSGPQILTVQADGSTTTVVTFSAPTTINAGQPSQLLVSGDSGTWAAQLDVDVALWESETFTGHNIGEPWALTVVDPETTPNLNPPQAGVTIA